MNRQEFIRELRIAMSGHFSSAEIQENVEYYEDYIDMQLRKGKTEKEVLDELGDPKLLIKTMRDAAKGKNSSVRGEAAYREVSGSSTRSSASGNAAHGQMKVVQVPCIVWVIGAVLIVLLILSIVGAIFGLIMRILLYLLPIILIAVALGWLYRYFTKK